MMMAKVFLSSSYIYSEDGVEHAERFHKVFFPTAPLTQLLKGDKAVLVRIDFLSEKREKKCFISDKDLLDDSPPN